MTLWFGMKKNQLMTLDEEEPINGTVIWDEEE
jgi:hypothetical protein